MDFKNILKLDKIEKPTTNKIFDSYEKLNNFLNEKNENIKKNVIKEDVYLYFLDNEYKLFDSINDIKTKYNILDLLEDKNLSYITHIFIKNSSLEIVEIDEEDIEIDEEN